jgi:hypothetical protein
MFKRNNSEATKNNETTAKHLKTKYKTRQFIVMILIIIEFVTAEEPKNHCYYCHMYV